MRAPLLALVAIIISSTFSAQAKMYKWVDEKNHVHFGDRIPPRYLTRAHDELNEQGVKIKHKAAAKTAEEKVEANRLKQAKKKIALINKKKRLRDRVLLDTYTTERDLYVARDSRLDAVGSQIQLAETIVNDANKKIEAMGKQITQIKASNREVPADFYQRLEIEKRQVAAQKKIMDKHKKRRSEVATQFNGFIERFKVLKAEQKARRAQRAKERGL